MNSNSTALDKEHKQISTRSLDSTCPTPTEKQKMPFSLGDSYPIQLAFKIRQNIIDGANCTMSNDTLFSDGTRITIHKDGDRKYIIKINPHNKILFIAELPKNHEKYVVLSSNRYIITYQYDSSDVYINIVAIWDTEAHSSHPISELKVEKDLYYIMPIDQNQVLLKNYDKRWQMCELKDPHHPFISNINYLQDPTLTTFCVEGNLVFNIYWNSITVYLFSEDKQTLQIHSKYFMNNLMKDPLARKRWSHNPLGAKVLKDGILILQCGTCLYVFDVDDVINKQQINYIGKCDFKCLPDTLPSEEKNPQAFMNCLKIQCSITSLHSLQVDEHGSVAFPSIKIDHQGTITCDSENQSACIQPLYNKRGYSENFYKTKDNPDGFPKELRSLIQSYLIPIPTIPYQALRHPRTIWSTSKQEEMKKLKNNSNSNQTTKVAANKNSS